MDLKTLDGHAGTVTVRDVEWPVGVLTMGDFARMDRKVRQQHVQAASDVLEDLPTDARTQAMRDAAERASKMSFMGSVDEYLQTTEGVATFLHFAIAAGLRRSDDQRQPPAISQLMESMTIRDVERFGGNGALIARIMGTDTAPKEDAAEAAKT